ncbi:hypothetical protein MHEL_16980 [Mycolicibacterium helvum]|uniref:Uncharacterized protein n=1 Tax=Mycolicibacterium helvum TaxID=1534349 RepID=A0A7I7T5E2_9MYCO|nr:hypothetical protein MHEL_16980 [Mycolicibacterium helvum]
MVTLPAGASGSAGAGSGAGRDSAAASFIGVMVRRAVGLATDSAGVDVLTVPLRRGPVTPAPAFCAGLRDRVVADDDGELEDADAPVESGEPESAAATAVATAEPVPATTPAIATPRHTCLIVATSLSPIRFQLFHSRITD